MAITIPQLIYFYTTASLESITLASEELHITQSALSRAISSLETDLGVELFERKGRNIKLNHQGEIVKLHANRIISQLEAMQNDHSESVMSDRQSISLMLDTSAALVMRLLGDFQKSHPEINVDVIQNSEGSIKGESTASDLFLYSNMTPITNNNTVTLFEENVLLAIAADSPLAAKPEVNLTDFANTAFITLPVGRDLRVITEFYCHMAGFSPKIAIESDNPYMIREFVSSGMGVSFIPEITWNEVLSDGVKALPVSSVSSKQYICLSWNDSIYLSESALRFKNYIVRYFKNYF